jgi:hypothetical protein
MMDYVAAIKQDGSRVSVEVVRSWVDRLEAASAKEGKLCFGLASVPIEVQIAMIDHLDKNALIEKFPEMQKNYEEQVASDPTKQEKGTFERLRQDCSRDLSSIRISRNGEELPVTALVIDSKIATLKEKIYRNDTLISLLADFKAGLDPFRGRELLNEYKTVDSQSSLTGSLELPGMAEEKTPNQLLGEFKSFFESETWMQMRSKAKAIEIAVK